MIYLQWIMLRIEEAKKLGVSNQEVRQLTNDLLKDIHVGTPHVGKSNPLINGINTDISSLVDEVWGVKAKKRQTSKV